LLVVFWFASITEVLFVSFTAFFVDRYVVLWQTVTIFGFHPYSDGKMQVQYSCPVFLPNVPVFRRKMEMSR
jgi:hypothetical protein